MRAWHNNKLPSQAAQKGQTSPPPTLEATAPAHPLARRDVPLARARAFRFTVFLSGSGQGCPQLRASDEHRFTVRVLLARRALGRSLSILLRPRVARARGSSQLPPLFQHPVKV